MHGDSVPHFLGLLVIILASARIAGILSRLTGQPAVLGELLAGVILGPSLLNCMDPQHDVLKMMAQIGVVILLFQIGMETDLRKLVAVWGPALAVAVVRLSSDRASAGRSVSIMRARLRREPSGP